MTQNNNTRAEAIKWFTNLTDAERSLLPYKLFTEVQIEQIYLSEMNKQDDNEIEKLENALFDEQTGMPTSTIHNKESWYKANAQLIDSYKSLQVRNAELEILKKNFDAMLAVTKDKNDYLAARNEELLDALKLAYDQINISEKQIAS